jgi:hypothetical protein
MTKCRKCGRPKRPSSNSMVNADGSLFGAPPTVPKAAYYMSPFKGPQQFAVNTREFGYVVNNEIRQIYRNNPHVRIKQKCLFCPEKFGSLGGFQGHIRKVHGDANIIGNTATLYQWNYCGLMHFAPSVGELVAFWLLMYYEAVAIACGIEMIEGFSYATNRYRCDTNRRPFEDNVQAGVNQYNFISSFIADYKSQVALGGNTARNMNPYDDRELLELLTEVGLGPDGPTSFSPRQ